MLIGLLSTYQIIFINSTSNDECLWYAGKNSRGEWGIVIRDVLPGGAADLAGIKNDDMLLAINGKMVNNAFDAQKILDKLDYGELAEYTIDRNGKQLTVNVRVKKVLNYLDLSYNIFLLVWLAVGYLVLISNPTGIVNVLFYLIGFLGVLSTTRGAFIDRFVYLNPKFEVPEWYFYPWIVINSFSAGVFIHFFLRFFKKGDGLYQRYEVYVNYAIVIMVSIYAIIDTHLRIIAGGGNGTGVQPDLVFTILHMIAYNFGLISLIVGTIRQWRSPEGVPLRWLTGIYILGFSAMVGVAFFAPRNNLIFYNNPEFYLVLLTLSLIPISFAYAIFRYQLMDVSIVVKNTILYGTVTVMVGVLYFVAIYVVGQMIGNAFGAEYRNFVALLSFVIFALAFKNTIERLQDLITRRFFPDQYSNTQILMGYSEELANIVGMENILKSVSRTFKDLILVKKFALYLSEGDTFTLAADFGVTDRREKPDSSISELEPRYIFFLEEGKDKVITQKSLEVFIGGDASWVTSENFPLIIPLKVNRKITGLMFLGEKLNGRPYAQKDIDSISSAASQIAVSLENARLYEEETKKVQLERDLNVAREIQESLLPGSFPINENIEIYGRMVPASHIGGDYFDVIKVSDSQFFLVIGDVSGKGLPAAIHMTRVQAMLRMLCTNDRTPSVILKELNRQIYSSLGKNWFITMTLIGLDTDKNCICICRAGHTPVLISQNGRTDFLQPRGLAVGLDKGDLFDLHLEELKLELQPGMSMLLFSDGVTEMMNPENELFGDERLKAVFNEFNGSSAPEMYEKLSEQLSNFRRDREAYDDETALFVKIKA